MSECRLLVPGSELLRESFEIACGCEEDRYVGRMIETLRVRMLSATGRLVRNVSLDLSTL